MFHVLLPVDVSEERAEAAATAVAQLPAAPTGVSVTVLNVFEEFDLPDDTGGRVKSENLFENYDRPMSVEVATDVLDENQVDWEFRAEHGDPAETILSVADELDTDLIVMSSGDRSPVGKVLFGSVAQGVLIDSDQPVLVA